MTQPSRQRAYLVTGGAGFIGSNFVELLVKRDHDVIVLDSLTYAGSPRNLENLGGTGRATLVQGDICDLALVSKLLRTHQPVGIVNFAAESHVDRSIDAPADFIRTNIEGTFALLSASLDYYQSLSDAAREHFMYLQISTDEVYGTLGDSGKFSESTPYAPNSPYSASKAAGDHLVRAWHHTYRLPTVTTNCSNNYGPRQFPEKLIPHVIQCALSMKSIPVYGNGRNVRDWIHVQDHCEGIFLALSKGKPGNTYCFGGDSERSNIEVVHQICKTLDNLRPRNDGKPHSTGIQFVTDRKGHDWRYAIDDRFAQSSLGFTRRFDFERGLEETIRWYLGNESWTKSILEKSSTY